LSPLPHLRNISSWVAHDLQDTSPGNNHIPLPFHACTPVDTAFAWLKSVEWQTNFFSGRVVRRPLNAFYHCTDEALPGCIHGLRRTRPEGYPCPRLGFGKKQNTMVFGAKLLHGRVGKATKFNALACIGRLGIRTRNIGTQYFPFLQNACLFQRSHENGFGKDRSKGGRM